MSTEYAICISEQCDRKARKFKKLSQVMVSGLRNWCAQFSVELPVIESGAFTIEANMEYVVIGRVDSPQCMQSGFSSFIGSQKLAIHEDAVHTIWTLDNPWQVSQEHLCGSSVSSPAFEFRGKVKS